MFSENSRKIPGEILEVIPGGIPREILKEILGNSLEISREIYVGIYIGIPGANFDEILGRISAESLKQPLEDS